MTQPPAYARLVFAPVADPAAVVHAGDARFTLLTSRLLRLEYSPTGRFEDRPSQAFWYRRQPVPPFRIAQDGDTLVVTTEHLELRYAGAGGFTRDALSVCLLADGTVWHVGDPPAGNLLGTCRTLDGADGPVTLQPGLLSREGWAVADDSAALVFNDDCWLEPREAAPGTRDLYFFGYGRDYRSCLRDYCAIAGETPLLPRWALGNWWSRYWAYSDEELTHLMDDFRAHDVPLSVCIVDMDWHLVDVGPGINGWTGYTWNRALFPDPPGFIQRLHARGLRTALNLHPALGVRSYEEMYPEMARRLGLDPDSGEPIPFNIADPAFAQAYFDVLHHPQEADGVDFWWIDWQQGTLAGMPGLDPLWWLNHLHFYDLGRDGKRPFIFSRWGGLGNHRYPIGFSGDTIVSWASLAFQPAFTATAANVGYGWWSHDIGGHQRGTEDGELFARWVQFGVFSPILRLHSTSNAFHDRRPWGYDAEVLRVTREAMQLRHALIPYLYTWSWLNEQTSVSAIRPLYHDAPDEEAAHACPQAYLFGDLVVAPYGAPADPDTRLSRQVFWLPGGDWYHLFDGEYHAGGAWYARHGRLDDIPVFAPAGAILPLGPRAGWGGVDNPAALEVHLFAGADGQFTLFEDDGETLAYREGRRALTGFRQHWSPGRLRLTVGPAEGDVSLLPPEREITLIIHGVSAPAAVEARVSGTVAAVGVAYDEPHESLAVTGLRLRPAERLDVTVSAAAGASLLSRRDRTQERCRAMLHAFRLETTAKSFIAQRLSRLAAEPDVLAGVAPALASGQLRALLETALGAGANVSRDLDGAPLIQLWNNGRRPEPRYRLATFSGSEWQEDKRYRSESGVLPAFRAIVPDGDRWQLKVAYANTMAFDVLVEEGTGRAVAVAEGD